MKRLFVAAAAAAFLKLPGGLSNVRAALVSRTRHFCHPYHRLNLGKCQHTRQRWNRKIIFIVCQMILMKSNSVSHLLRFPSAERGFECIKAASNGFLYIIIVQGLKNRTLPTFRRRRRINSPARAARACWTRDRGGRSVARVRELSRRSPMKNVHCLLLADRVGQRSVGVRRRDE